MNKIVIFTDSGSDYMKDIKLNNVVLLPNTYFLKGEEDVVYQGDVEQNKKVLFDYMKLGVEPIFKSVDKETVKKTMQKYCEEGYDIICITSGSYINYSNYDSFLEARELSQFKYLRSQIAVIDSKSFTLVERLLVQYANQLVEKGLSFEEVLYSVLRYRDSFIFEAMLGNENNDISRYSTFKTIEKLKNRLNLDTVYNLANGVRTTKVVKNDKDRVEVLLNGLFKKNIDGNVVGIVHTNCEEEADEIQKVISSHGYLSYQYEPNIINSIVMGDKSLGLVYQKR